MGVLAEDILFAKLKYEILSKDSNTWHLCKTYPLEVRRKWAWRCAADVEHLAKGYPEAEECIRVAKAYRDGLATLEELSNADRAVYYASVCYGSITSPCTNSPRAAYYAALATGRAAYHAAKATSCQEEKWNMYIDWLIEELCNWEKK
jgi:hypothetical protein